MIWIEALAPGRSCRSTRFSGLAALAGAEGHLEFNRLARARENVAKLDPAVSAETSASRVRRNAAAAGREKQGRRSGVVSSSAELDVARHVSAATRLVLTF